MTDATVGGRDRSQLRTMLAEAEIKSVLARYCRAIDRMDPALIRSVYHSDARDNHVSFSGSVDEFAVWVCEVALAAYEWTMHNLGTCNLQIVGDVAYVETYAICYHGRATADDDGLEILKTSAVRYIDRFESREDGPWLIADRLVVVDWRREEQIRSQRRTRPQELTGQRGPADPSYVLRRGAGDVAAVSGGWALF